jgi:hypothetical protein
MGANDLSSLAKKDEEIYIKSLKEREEKEIRKEQDRSRSREQSKSTNIQLLSF